MKSFFLVPAVLLLALVCTYAENDVWYDASGKVVKVTRAQKEPVTFIPDWKKREIERLEAQRTGSYQSGVQRTRSSWYAGYPYHGGRSYYSGYSRRFYDHGHHRSSLRFRGSYHGNGWSVRVRY